MQRARVVGHAVSTIKHASMTGWRLVVVQPLGPTGKPDGEPLLAIDRFGVAQGQMAIISNDGQGARELVGYKNSPVRWFVMGIEDV